MTSDRDNRSMGGSRSQHRDDSSLEPPEPPPFQAASSDDRFEDEEKRADDDDDDDNEDYGDNADGEGAMIEIDLEALTEASKKQADDNPTPTDARHNRAFMTVLHFVLTYPRWSFSLFLLFASWTTPLPTAQEQITQPFRDLQTVVRTEAKLYHDCVERSFRFQDVQMERMVAAEEKRVASVRNAANLLETARWTEQCSNATILVQRSLQNWFNMGLDLPNRTLLTENGAETTSCSADDRERLNELLGADLTKLNNSIQSILDAFIAQSLEALRRVVKYSQERSIYDYEYFVGIKLEAIIGVLDGFSTPAISLTLPEQKLVLELRNILQDLLDALRGAYVRIDLLTIRIAEFKASIEGFSLHYKDLYGRFAEIRAWVRDFLPDGFSLPDVFDISGLPIASALLPPIFQIPQFGGALPDIDDMISEYIIKALKLIGWVLEEAAKEATEQTRRIIEELLELLRKLTLLEDYDPPKYPRSDRVKGSDDEVAHLQGLADKTQADTEVALDDLKVLYSDVPEPIKDDVEDVDKPIVIGDANQTQFNFLDLSVPEIAIPVWILKVFGYVASFTFLIECAVQAVRFYKLKRKYESASVPDLPEIDYIQRIEEEQEEGNDDENKLSKLQLAQSILLKNMMNPMVVVGLVLLPFVLSVLIFWFPHVKATCIDSRRGTFLARHVFKQVQVNKANAQGYKLHTAAQWQCHRKQRAYCSRQSTESDIAYRNQAATFFALQTRFNESTEILGIVDRCVDLAKLDIAFQSNCCGLEGYMHDGTICPVNQQRDLCPVDEQASPPAAFPPVGETALNPACRVDPTIFLFDEALFNCSILEQTCTRVPCSGVDADLIEEMTIEADCSAEIHIIQVCLFLALTVFHAVMINIWDTLLFNGIMHLRWRKIKPDGIKLTTHVTAGGELVKGGDVQERTERFERALKRFELAGWTQIVLSAVVFLVWIASFVAIKKIVSHFAMYHA